MIKPELRNVDVFMIEDQIVYADGVTNYSMICNNVLQYSIFGFLKGLGKYVVGCNPKSRYGYEKA